MAIKHARAGVTHHGTHLFAFVGLVTVDRAVGARRLFFLEGAFIEASVSVICKLAACRAELVLGFVVVAAIDANHHIDGSAFPIHSRMVT